MNLSLYYNNKLNEDKLTYPFDIIIKMITLNNNYNIKNRNMMLSLKNDISVRNFEKSTNETFIKSVKNKLPLSIHMEKLNLNTDKSFIENSPILNQIYKEFVFDIDLDDFDDLFNTKLCLFNGKLNKDEIQFKSLRICGCIGQKKACSKCWYLMGSSSIVIKFFMEKFFNINKFLWVYSGNRGIHCWINNKQLNLLNENSRKNIMNLMILNTDKEIFNKMNNNLFKELFEKELNPYFLTKILPTTLFNYLEPLILEFINCYYPLIYNSLNHTWKLKNLTNEYKWNLLIEYSISIKESINIFLIFRLLYPIFDTNVSISISHLLKLPYSIHSKTNRLSIPIPFDSIYSLPIDDYEFIKSISFIKENNGKIIRDSIYLIEEWL